MRGWPQGAPRDMGTWGSPVERGQAGVRREEPSVGEGDDVRKVPSESSTVRVAGGSGAGAWGAEA